ncbi:MAG TPA: HEAT repeat domain-containing protein [Halococcus sp.]|nr:HEAT repeat domain-containing protein [Halococcus sp.]
MSDGDEERDEATETGNGEQADQPAEEADTTEDESDSADEEITETTEEESETDAESAETDTETDDSSEGEEAGGDSVESLDARLDDIETDIEEAETEAELDAVETDLDSVEADIEDADLPGPAADEEDAADPREELESRVSELHEAISGKRGPYAEDAVEQIEGAKSTITETRWTEQGETEIVAAVESFLDDVGEILDAEFTAESDEHAALTAALDDVTDTIEDRNLDPDTDGETIAALLNATDELTTDLDEAEEWDDLSVREKLAVEGFYDVLTPENRKDYPPEWNAIKIYERQNEPEPILRGLDMFGSDFMEDHCIESLTRMGSPEAFDAMEQRAQRRDKPPIEALGKIGDDRALDTLHEYIEGESDPALQKVTLKAIGEIGSADSTQQVADRLVAENETVRSNAARALGLIGDTRAISPLSDVLTDDESNSVRASAAWALNQIGTENALDTAREHADDRSFLVQSEAEKAAAALTDEADESAETVA